MTKWVKLTKGGVEFATDYTSRAEELDIEREKSKARFQLMVGDNPSDFELLKARLYWLYAEEKMKGKSLVTPVQTALENVLKVLNGESIAGSVSQIEINLLMNTRARRYLMLFKNECPLVLKEKIFVAEFKRCRRQIVDPVKQVEMNKIVYNNQIVLNIDNIPDTLAGNSRIKRCLEHFRTEWEKDSISKRPSNADNVQWEKSHEKIDNQAALAASAYLASTPSKEKASLYSRTTDAVVNYFWPSIKKAAAIMVSLYKERPVDIKAKEDSCVIMALAENNQCQKIADTFSGGMLELIKMDNDLAENYTQYQNLKRVQLEALADMIRN